MNMTFGKTFLASLLASILAGVIIVGVFFLIMSSLVAGLESAFESKKLVVEENTVLHMELNDQIGDYSYVNFDKTNLGIVKQFGLNTFVKGLEIAKTDDKIKGIFLNCDNVPAGMASVKEMRDALADFQTSGKFIVAYHENYDNKAYYLSSVADELYVFPSGMMEFLGLGAELVFLKGALEKLDVEMQIIRGSNNRFKSAVEPLIYEKMSEANRLQTEKYLDALWGIMLNEISDSRGITTERLNEIADSVFIRKAGDAVSYKMADGAKYYDEILAILREKAQTPADDDLNLLSFKKYAKKMVDDEEILASTAEKNIAVIFAEGEIVDGNGEMNQIGGTTMSKLIREAREDETIKAIVLRINSPGGSALASDIIWREVVLAKKEGKPVVVSMGDVAASGGYYIACAADKIYAQPNTITGSIGVFGIIPYLGDMFKNKLGVTFDRVETNEHSVLSLTKKLDAEELQLIQEGVDDIYDDFISKVAEGRGMKKEEVDSIGQGRVWAGVDALEIGLIDEYGSLQDAILDAAERASIDEGAIAIKHYPAIEKNEFTELIELIEEGGETKLVARSQIERQLMEIYNYVQTIGHTKTIQARLPYLYWIN